MMVFFYGFKKVCPRQNYADDNTISCYSHDMDVLEEQFEANAKPGSHLFDTNYMRTNP